MRAMCGAQFRNRRRGEEDVVLVLGSSKAMDQLTIASTVCWNGHLLKRRIDIAF